MEYFMVPILVMMSILSVYGTIYNKRTKNLPGFYIGGLFTVGLVLITLLSVYDMLFSVDTILPYIPW